VNSLFGGSTNLVVSQVEKSTSEPIVSTGSSKVLEIKIEDIFFLSKKHLSWKLKLGCLIISKNKTTKEFSFWESDQYG
jgi:hypothetical protein